MKISRRKFIVGSAIAGTGLAVGFLIEGKPFPNKVEGSFQPNAWLQILENGDVIFQLDKTEMGQGVMTGLTTIIAEELDVDPATIKVQMAGIHGDYVNPELGTQLTGASASMRTSWERLREAGAVTRAMLVTAAASIWNVPESQCKTEPGKVINTGNGHQLAYGFLSKRASNLPVPSHAPLKSPKDYRWIGKADSKRLDTQAKVNATAEFGIDVQLPNMKHAVVVRSPYFGGKVKSFDAASVKDEPGVIDVREIHSGIAIVADSYWQARQAANQLKVEWDKGPLAGLDSAGIKRRHEDALAKNDGFNVKSDGDIETALATDRKIEANYSVPYFHHSTMEPQNATALFENQKMTIWAPSQSPDIAQAVAAHYTGMDREHIDVNITYLGGGFGRRGYCDFAGEVASIAKAMPGVPIKLIWSREDDMQHDYYRPISTHKITAALGQDGLINGWQHTLVSNSIITGYTVDLMSALVPNWVPMQMARGYGKWVSGWMGDYDITMAEGASPAFSAEGGISQNYAIDNISVDIIHDDPGIPTGFWRSVAHSYNGFVVETMMDEMAHLAQADPLDFRIKHLDHNPQLAACIEAVAEMANWKNKPEGVSLGVASHTSFRSHCAQIVELIENEKNGKPEIRKVYCAISAGRAINPQVIKDQMMSGIVYGLTAAIKPPITIKDGRAVGSNFHDLPVLRANECPEIEVVVLDSEDDPTGVGEVGVPPIAPALGNALFVFNGKRQRDLPFNMG